MVLFLQLLEMLTIYLTCFRYFVSGLAEKKCGNCVRVCGMVVFQRGPGKSSGKGSQKPEAEAVLVNEFNILTFLIA